MYAAKQRHHPHEAREHAERDGRTASSGRSDDVVSSLPILAPIIRTGYRSGIGRNALRWSGFHARLIICVARPLRCDWSYVDCASTVCNVSVGISPASAMTGHFLGLVVAHGHSFPALPNVLSDAYCTATLPPTVAIVLIRSPVGMTGALPSSVKHGQY